MSAHSGLLAVGEGRSTLLPSKDDTEIAIRARQQLQKLASGLDQGLAASLKGSFLIEKKPVQIEIPVAAMQMLIQIMGQMAQGKPVSIIPANAELTTQQAADFLNVSRPYLVKLLEENKIPHRKIGTRRRVQFKDLVTFKAQDSIRQHKAANELTEISQEIARDLGEDY